MKRTKPILLMLVLMFFLLVPYVKAVTWDLLDEDWDDVTGWTEAGAGTSEIDPAGQLHNEPNSGTYITRYQDIGALPTEYTVEFYLIIDSFGAGDGLVRMDFYDGEHLIQFVINATHIGYVNSSVVYSWFAHVVGNDWHTWRLVCDSDDDLFRVYKDEVLITTFTDLRDYASSDGTVYAALTQNEAGNDGAETHTDYLRIASGLEDYLQYVTFYHNTGGILRANNVTMTNTTETGYVNQTTVELVAIVEGNLTYGFNNFTYDSSSNISNPYSITVTENVTVWCYFGEISTVDEGKNAGWYAAGLGILALCVLIPSAFVLKRLI